MDLAVTDFFKTIRENDSAKMIEIITKNKLDVNIKDSSNRGRTALHIAALRGHEEMVKKLVNEYNADFNIKDENGNVPLNLAADSYHVKIVKFLVERNSDHSGDVQDLLNDPVTDNFFEAVASNNTKRVKELLDENKVKVDDRNLGDYKKTALHVAAMNGYEELINILVDDYKANVNLDDEFGELPIHIAADRGHIDIVKFLIKRNSDKVEDIKELLEEENNLAKENSSCMGDVQDILKDVKENDLTKKIEDVQDQFNT